MEQTNSCAICLTGYQNEEPYVLHCNHSFHCDCIIQWFRSSKGNCPLCNDNPYSDSEINDNYLFFHFSQGYIDERYKLLLKLSKKKTTPPNLTKEIKKMTNMNNNYKLFCKEMKDYEKTEEVKQMNKILRNYRNKNWKFKRNIEKQKHKIVAMYPTLYL